MGYRKLFYASNALLLAGFAWAFLKDHNAEWKPYQSNFNRMTAGELDKRAAAEPDPQKAAALRVQAADWRRRPLEIKQIIVGGLDRYDRCITCHAGMDEYSNPTLKTPFAENPYKGHPKIDEALAKAHPFTKFGCTVCHQGQGLATTAEAAHGWVKHWERPMLKGTHIQASCVKCHGDFETLRGAEAAALGKKVFERQGCQGCHAINGVGGAVSVDLGDIADKPLERIAGYNFKRVRIDGKELPEESWNIQNWILGHLTNDPAEVTPNDPMARYNAEPIAPSAMPDFRQEISRREADAVTAYLSGLTKEELIPSRWYVPGPRPREPRFADAAAHGRYVFRKYGCQGCHGLDAKVGRRRFNALGPGQNKLADGATEEALMAEMEKGLEPTLPDVVGTYTHEELVKKIENGVPLAAMDLFHPKGPVPAMYMPPWKDKISKAELDDLSTWLLSIAKKDDSGF
ncbi:MAG: c-type cytochrome [Elusimicrobia bacterium]|nr:c-type cytochrome [Elusimicrobiota bacterium]